MTVDRFSDAFVLEQAKGCESLAQLWRKLGWPDFQHVRRVNDRLSLGLPVIKSSREGAPRAAQPVPKPTGKQAKPTAKGEAE